MLEAEPTFLTRTRLGEIPPASDAPPVRAPGRITSPGDRHGAPRAQGTSNPFSRTEQRPRFVAAGFFRRTLGAVIDVAILLPVVFLLGWLGAMVTGIHLPEARHHSVDFWADMVLALDPALCGFATLFAITFFAYAGTFQALRGATPGMMATRTRVIDVYGDAPNVGRALARTGAYFASVATLGLGFLWAGFDAEHRGLHDWLAGTYVVKA